MTGSDEAALANGGMDWAAGCWVDQARRSDWTRWLTASKSCSRESVERSPAPAGAAGDEADDVDAVEEGAAGAVRRRAACLLRVTLGM